MSVIMPMLLTPSKLMYTPRHCTKGAFHYHMTTYTYIQFLRVHSWDLVTQEHLKLPVYQGMISLSPSLSFSFAPLFQLVCLFPLSLPLILFSVSYCYCSFLIRLGTTPVVLSHLKRTGNFLPALK